MHRVNYRSIALLLFFVAFSTGIFGQYSRTYDLYGYSSEVGRDILKIENNTYVTVSSVCEFPVRFCTDLVSFKEDGEIEWTKKLDWISPPFKAMTNNDNVIYVAGEGNRSLQEFVIYKSSIDGDSLGVIRENDNNAWREISILGLENTGEGLVLNGSISKMGDDGQDALIAWIDYDLTLDTFIINDNLGPQSTILETTTVGDITYALFVETENNPNNNSLIYYRGILKFNLQKEKEIIFLTDLENLYNPVGSNLEIFQNGNYVFINQNGEHFMAPKIQCFSPTGDLLWEYIYEYQLNQHTLLDLKILEDESIVICGEYASIGEDILSVGFIMKLNNTGEFLWSRYYSAGKYADNVHESLAGKERFSSLNGLIVEEDYIYLTGRASNLDLFNEEFYNHSDIWLLKVDKDGCYIPDCLSWQNVSSTNELLLSENENISLYPVPTSGVLNIKHIGNQLYQTIIIYDLQGQPIYTIIGSTDQIDVSMLTTGIYVARFYDRDHRTMAVKKFSKV